MSDSQAEKSGDRRRSKPSVPNEMPRLVIRPSTGAESAAARTPTTPRTKPLSVMRAIIGDCLCEPFPFNENRGLSQTSQFVSLHGVESISLGAVVDELTAEQRVKDTLDQLTAETKRMISIGYLVDSPTVSSNQVSVGETTKLTETVDLQVWRNNYPNDNMSKAVLQKIKFMEVGI